MPLSESCHDDIWGEAGALADDASGLAACEAIARAAADHVSWHDASLCLVASRNLLSPRARAMMASGLMERVAGGGRVGERRKSGLAMLDRIEAILVQLTRRLFGVAHVEYRVPTGSVANALFLLGVTEPGERIMVLPRRFGGHGTYGEEGYAGARGLEVLEMPCTGSDSGEVDLDRLAAAVARHEPRWLVVGSSWPLFPYPLAEIEAIAAEAGGRILYDAAHVLGLIAGGCYQHPLREGAAALTASTHKTFPGPVGGIILTNDDDLASRIHDFTDRAIGNYHNQRAAALAVTLAEMAAFGQAYAAATVENAGALARALDAEGFGVVGRERGFTRSHVVVLDLGGTMTPAEAVKGLETARITCEAIPLPRDFPRAAALRLGTPSLTRRGMGPGEMAVVAGFVRRIILEREDPRAVKGDVLALSSAFTKVRYCFEGASERSESPGGGRC